MRESSATPHDEPQPNARARAARQLPSVRTARSEPQPAEHGADRPRRLRVDDHQPRHPGRPPHPRERESDADRSNGQAGGCARHRAAQSGIHRTRSSAPPLSHRRRIASSPATPSRASPPATVLSTASVLAMNGLGWKSMIFPGQVLKLSAAASRRRSPHPRRGSGAVPRPSRGPPDREVRRSSPADTHPRNHSQLPASPPSRLARRANGLERCASLDLPGAARRPIPRAARGGSRPVEHSCG